MVWDPVSVDENNIRNNVSKLESKLEKYKKNPSSLRRNYYLFFFFGLLGSFASAFLMIFYEPYFMWGIVLSMIPFSVLASKYHSLGKDLIKLQIARENGWLYDPNNHYNRWSKYAKAFPEIYRQGNQGQYLDDRFWGKVSNNDFHCGNFTYQVRKKSGKKSHTRTYHTYYFIFPLKKRIASRFLLYGENIFSKIGNFFTKKEINTESIEFNKIFAFSYNGRKDEHAINIVKSLSPAIQEKLIHLKKNSDLLKYCLQTIQ
ncbi:hypothetical protein C0585_02475 [Candidatus Woesearchaeota archaeon]|nr:MAG: hypothetical protein C0585_02475 [Candidatus Woesearchaeota archaeon]